MASNALIGKLILAFSILLFTYYVFWVFVLPFILVDEDNWIHSLFPPIHLSLILPAVLGIIFFGGLSLYTIYHIRELIPFIN